ncbi:hypothetical protein AVEN_37416-1 [Araneus ventricosus]|uniref:RNase H type-1 domain-containing protein n=1 Tax=Araneus ventricosus TaxID=182803 RepID=A0A4Y2HZA8_ARAVE|nr:hypothetical protein AVEN_37416-1 [Araneus ventricosus]
MHNLPKHDEPPPWRSRDVLTIDDFNKLPKSTTAPSVYIQEFCYHKQKFERYGHVGITGNDEADAAAKAASSNVETFVPFQDIDQVLKQTILIKWQHTWDLELNNKLHSIQPSIAGFKPNDLNRRMSVKLARLRLGHTYFTHKHLLHADPAPSCSSYSTIISVRHILCECPKYRVLRQKYFGKAYSDLRDVLGEPYNTNVFSFVHDITFIHSI